MYRRSLEADRRDRREYQARSFSCDAPYRSCLGRRGKVLHPPSIVHPCCALVEFERISDNLNQSYRELVIQKNINTVSYYEKFKTKNAFLVVSEESADPGVSGTRPIPLDVDHISICKPESRQSLVYVSLVRHITAVLKSCTLSRGSEAFAADDYGKKSETDRRDLLQKLIDAGREYEFQTVNDLQNKFAQRYYKLGLYTEAKNKSDAILANVEQRFITHVYNTKICRGASDDEIAEALQAHVIDPISTGNVSGSAILQALYFLTEQCFIQRDSPV